MSMVYDSTQITMKDCFIMQACDAPAPDIVGVSVDEETIGTDCEAATSTEMALVFSSGGGVRRK